MIDTYGLLFQQLLYPGWESGIRRRPTLAHLKRLERTQWCSLDELRAIQEAELGKLLSHAWRNVPYYRGRFEKAGLGPHDVKRVEDLAKLPLLSREEAAQNFDARKSSAAPLPVIGKMTSGTTGHPLSFAYDRGSEHWRQATKLRGYAWAGYRLGDRSLHFWGAPPAAPPPLTQRLKVSVDRAIRREHYANCTGRSPETLARVVREIRALRPSVIVCYAQAGVALARYVNEEKARDWDDIPLIAAAERLFPTDRQAINEAFGPGIFETYGSREVMLMAAECEAHQGLHISMENLVIELIVRDENGERPARPGELGEVVVTDLHNYGAPFIRYVNGDSAIARAPERCVCGRSLSRLECVEGRTLDTLRDGDGRPVSGMFFIVLFAGLAQEVKGFQVVQRRDRAIDLKILPTGAFDDSLLELVQGHCKKNIPGVTLRTEIVSELNPDRGGKLRVVVVEN
jgi:phenylacetate-coenzyme A ligase PaaK-like adenylate-forming protein